MDKISLLKAPLGCEVILSSFEGGREFIYRLNRIGLFPGDTVKVIRVAPLKGPLLLESGGREIALGRGVAARVMIEIPA